nr:MAG TPA: hypothetical protein [Caudoviricetes sp.]
MQDFLNYFFFLEDDYLVKFVFMRKENLFSVEVSVTNFNH